MTDNIISKICTKCKIEKPLSEYYNSSKPLDGKNCRCKTCVQSAQRKFRLENKNHVKLRKAEEYLKNKADPEWVAKQKQKRSERKEWKAEYDKQYRSDNKEKCAMADKRWALANVDKIRAINSTYKAKRRVWESATVEETSKIAEWVESVEKVCYWCHCDCEDNYHVDHYFPLSKGGSHTVDNLVIACPTCNLRKSAKLPDAFRAELDRELEELNK